MIKFTLASYIIKGATSLMYLSAANKENVPSPIVPKVEPLPQILQISPIPNMPLYYDLDDKGISLMILLLNNIFILLEMLGVRKYFLAKFPSAKGPET